MERLMYQHDTIMLLWESFLCVVECGKFKLDDFFIPVEAVLSCLLLSPSLLAASLPSVRMARL